MVHVIALGQESSKAGVVLLPVLVVVEFLLDDPFAVTVCMSSDAGFAAMVL